MRFLPCLTWILSVMACSCGSTVEAGPGDAEPAAARGEACPGSVWDVQEGEACALDLDIESCIYADSDCPGATLIYRCPIKSVWEVEISWSIPNCNSPATCPDEPQKLGGKCNVK